MVHYSLNELHERFLNDKKFIRLFKEWVKSGYNMQLKPSIDRINYKKNYYIDNIHILTWAENRYKQRMEFKGIRARRVFQILNGGVVKTFKSVSDTVKKTGIHQGNLSSCLHGKRNHVAGYEWSYENPELLNGKDRE